MALVSDDLAPHTQRDLISSVGDAASFSVMVGVGETYIAPFAVALGTGGIATGLLTTIPVFAGAILQLMTPRMIRRIGSHRTWVVGCAAVQAVALLCLPLAIFLGGWGAGLVYLAATIYWASGQAGNPAWNTWIEDVVPVNVRTRFFARRSRVSQLCLLVGLWIGGLALEFGKSRTGEHAPINWANATMLAFAGIFVFAAVCRFVSATFLTRHSEPNRGRLIDQHISLAQWSRRLREHNGAKLLLFLFVMQASVYISGPYFSPYMLLEMKLGYFEYMALVSICLVGKAIALPFWGRFAHRHGARKLLWIGAVSILPLSALWIVSMNYAWAAFIQFASGVTWAAFELAIVLMFFEAIPRHERTSLVTLYNLSNASAMICGTLLGAAILHAFDEALFGYRLIFGLSSFSRIFAVLLLMRLSHVVEKVPIDVEGALALHPSTHNADRPIFAGIPETDEAAAETKAAEAITTPAPAPPAPQAA